jgi:hypothetical protein
MTAVTGLRDAIAGRLDGWRWGLGLDPATVAAALGTTVSTGPILHAGLLRQAGTLQVPGAPWPVWAVWDDDGELVLIEVREPPDAPASAGAIAAFGEPDAKLPRGAGPHPSYEQFAYLARGFTLFEWFEMPPAALWLYRPTDLDHYVADLGADISPTRPRR